MKDDILSIEEKYHSLMGHLDEATLRLWAAVEARSLGRGGVSKVAKALRMSRTTIYAGPFCTGTKMTGARPLSPNLGNHRPLTGGDMQK
jgi:hypothetical protein